MARACSTRPGSSRRSAIPHIVAVHDVGEHDGAVFVAMELVDGRPLSHLVQPGVPIAEVLELAIGVATGLARAHAAGVVHRDLKPADVRFMPERFGAKILDFGLATRTASFGGGTSTFAALGGPGVVAGTVGYMSPEQAEGRRWTPNRHLRVRPWCTRCSRAGGRSTGSRARPRWRRSSATPPPAAGRLASRCAGAARTASTIGACARIRIGGCSRWPT